jgi:hypothetical protein
MKFPTLTKCRIESSAAMKIGPLNSLFCFMVRSPKFNRNFIRNPTRMDLEQRKTKKNRYSSLCYLYSPIGIPPQLYNITKFMNSAIFYVHVTENGEKSSQEFPYNVFSKIRMVRGFHVITIKSKRFCRT